ncbi:MAG TPA: hypothetical protein DCZ92_00850 [Elusimicrobia bacterium]|nr:MAG: hypothetical protein A2016_04550 [Elusimicrobia bacterium GWF2_62_30]HBA59374.1 hypothetical protein [Elusimicrobiota bacterium]
MTPKEIYLKKVSRERYAIYWDKAMEFFESMVDAALKHNWNAAGLAGVHCCISATDALLVKHAGVRSSSDSHQDVVGLLQSTIRDEAVSKQAKRLGEILAQKNLIEYIDKSYTEKDAVALKVSVERYIEWARRVL